MDQSKVVEIQHEYDRIHKNWLKLHYRTSAALFVFSVIMEGLIGWVACNSDQLTTTVPIFIFKFFLFPATLNLSCIIIDTAVMRSKTISQKDKVYVVSILFVLMCFVLFTVHIAYSSLYFIFAIAIVLTTVYADYKLTAASACASIIFVIIAELFIKWDQDKISIFESSLRLIDFIVSIIILISFFAACMVVIKFEQEKNAAIVQKEMDRNRLKQKLEIDELTGINNRKSLHRALTDMEEDQSGNTYIFAMIDIDNFKALNDHLGHLEGDNCLIEFGRIMKENCGQAIPYRYGGDEFSILFQNQSIGEVIKTCEKIQKNLALSCNKIGGTVFTVSFGIAIYHKNMDMAGLIIRADQALYEAKTVKNTIRIFRDTDQDENFIR